MKQCAFCSSTAKMSGEHVFSDWMNGALPSPVSSGGWNGILTRPGSPQIPYKSLALDWTVKVVCEECNNGWMNEIENKHAKPVMAPLIGGKIHIPISQLNARSIALFAFKTAVIVDLLRKSSDDHFFSRRQRTAFKNHLTIPASVAMWMCVYAPRKSRRADVFSGYYSGDIPLMGPVQLYVCTYGVGNFAFQVLSVKHISSQGGFATDKFENLSVPFWPKIAPGFVWPIPIGLRSVEEFTQYHQRWEALIPMQF